VWPSCDLLSTCRHSPNYLTKIISIKLFIFTLEGCDLLTLADKYFSYIGKGFKSKGLVELRLNGLWLPQIAVEFVTSHTKVTLTSKNPVSSSYPFIIHFLMTLTLVGSLQYNNGFIYLAHLIGSI